MKLYQNWLINDNAREMTKDEHTYIHIYKGEHAYIHMQRTHIRVYVQTLYRFHNSVVRGIIIVNSVKIDVKCFSYT